MSTETGYDCRQYEIQAIKILGVIFIFFAWYYILLPLPSYSDPFHSLSNFVCYFFVPFIKCINCVILFKFRSNLINSTRRYHSPNMTAKSSVNPPSVLPVCCITIRSLRHTTTASRSTSCTGLSIALQCKTTGCSMIQPGEIIIKQQPIHRTNKNNLAVTQSF